MGRPASPSSKKGPGVDALSAPDPPTTCYGHSGHVYSGSSMCCKVHLAPRRWARSDGAARPRAGAARAQGGIAREGVLSSFRAGFVEGFASGCEAAAASRAGQD